MNCKTNWLFFASEKALSPEDMTCNGPVEKLMDLVCSGFCKCPNSGIGISQAGFDDGPHAYLIQFPKTPCEMPEGNKSVPPHCGISVSGETQACLHGCAQFRGEERHRKRHERKFVRLIPLDGGPYVFGRERRKILKSWHVAL
jgi:hypothetical protein